nr:hypothetical protein Iba_chr07eCG4640 [Ipomoea batatas]
MPASASIVEVYTDSSGPTLLTVLVIALGSPLFRFETAMDGGTAEALKFGFCAFTVATIPEICGQDMEVPDSRLLRCVEYLDDCVVAQDDLRLEIAVHGGGGDGENPGSFVDDSTAAWSRVSGGADNDDASLDGMEGADGDNIGGEIGFESTTWAQRQRQHVHAILNPVVEGFQDRRS